MTKSNIKIANAPCSWGALEFGLEGEKIGFSQVLNEIKETGYAGTELGDWGFMPTDPVKLGEEIRKRNLALVAAFVPVALSEERNHQEGIAKALKVARLMYAAGYPEAFIVLADDNGTVEYRTKNAGRIRPGEGLTSGQVKTFSMGVEKVARALKEELSMRLVFHHHCGGYIETPEEIEHLLSLTDPNLVGLCFDTGHFKFGGGGDPGKFMVKYWDRIRHIHFKDFSQKVAADAIKNKWDYFQSVGHGVFCELGKGEVNFKSIRDLLLEKEYNGWIVVEQDILPGMGNPSQYALNNRMYLSEIGL